VKIVALKFNIGFNIKITKPFIFDRDFSKVVEFKLAYRLYIRIRMREIAVEKQI